MSAFISPAPVADRTEVHRLILGRLQNTQSPQYAWGASRRGDFSSSSRICYVRRGASSRLRDSTTPHACAILPPEIHNNANLVVARSLV